VIGPAARTSRPRGSRHHGLLALLGLGLGLALTGCLSPIPSTMPSTGAPGVAPSPVVTRFDLGATVWIDGFVVNIDSATASLDAKGGPVSVIMRIENPGTEPASLDAPVRLTASGAAFDVAHGTTLPEIPAGANVTLMIEFEVTGRSTIDDGVLRIGRTADHQVQVPFGPGAVQLITLQPVAFDLKGAATAGGLRAVLHRGVVRWDLPDWHTELPNATEALTLTYDASYVGDFVGGLAFTADSVGLRLPDGTVVAPRADGHSQSIALIGPKKTIRGLESRFEIPTGLTGNFALIIRDGSTQKAIPFTIGP
jgi:hypothetical protein